MGKGKSPRRVADNEALAVGTQIRGSAQKLNLVAALIRGKKAEEALEAEKKAEADAAKAAKLVEASKPAPTPAPAPAPQVPSGPSGGQVLPKEEISPETLALLKSLKKN